MRTIALVSVLALCGCGTMTTIQRVEIPVPVPCIARSQIPPAPVSQFDMTMAATPIDEQVRALLVDRERNKPYVARSQALLEACSMTDATISADRSPSPVKP